MSARMPADLCCNDFVVEPMQLNHTSVNDEENAQCCKGCAISSKIGLELEQCLQIIVSEYEQVSEYLIMR